MLSGIGEADHLRAIGVAPRVNLPGVGRNLQDHLSVDVHHLRRGRGPFHAEMRLDRTALNMVRAYVFGTGPGTVLPSRLHAFLKTRRELPVPDIQFLFRGAPAQARPWPIAGPTPRSTRSCDAPRSPRTTRAPRARWARATTRCWTRRCACGASRGSASSMPRPCPTWSRATSTPAC